MRLLSECHVFVYEVMMMWWCCWVSVIFLCMNLGWSYEVVECVSCVCVWSDDDLMMLLIECRVFVDEVRIMWWCSWVSVKFFEYEVRMIWWRCWVSVLSLRMKWGWFDDVVDWVSCICGWSEDDLMRLLSECHVFVFEWEWYNHFLEYIVGLWSKVNDDAVE